MSESLSMQSQLAKIHWGGGGGVVHLFLKTAFWMAYQISYVVLCCLYLKN